MAFTIDLINFNVSRLEHSPPDSINRFSNPRSHMVVAAWLAILSSSSYTMRIFPAAFFYTVCELS